MYSQKKDMKKSVDLMLRIKGFVSAFIERYKDIVKTSPIKERSELPFYTDKCFSIKGYVSQDENVLHWFDCLYIIVDCHLFLKNKATWR